MSEETKKPIKPPWVKPRIIAAPKVRQIYWCDFWQDAHLPEMWKTRPVIVVTYKNTLHGPCLVVPTSTEPSNANNRWACKLSIKLEDSLGVMGNLQSSIDGRAKPLLAVQRQNPILAGKGLQPSP